MKWLLEIDYVMHSCFPYLTWSNLVQVPFFRHACHNDSICLSWTCLIAANAVTGAKSIFSMKVVQMTSQFWNVSTWYLTNFLCFKSWSLWLFVWRMLNISRQLSDCFMHQNFLYSLCQIFNSFLAFILCSRCRDCGTRPLGGFFWVFLWFYITNLCYSCATGFF